MISTTSISDKFVSYENTVIHIPSCLDPSNSSKDPSSWNINITKKYNDSLMECNDDKTDENISNDEYICIVFGICNSSLLEKGYKHRYYGYGYSVTYCDNIKFQSFATRFKKTDQIILKYDQFKGEISFSPNDGM